MKLLRESVHQDIQELQNALAKQQNNIIKLEGSLVESQKEVKSFLTDKIDLNTRDIKQIMDENRCLRKKNNQLKEWISKIEMLQLENNIIISGQPEQPWEPYESTKEREIDTIAVSLGSLDSGLVRQEARNIKISCCSRVGRYKMGRARPISVTFQKKDDKQTLIANKRNLLSGIYVNEEFSLHINHDMLRPILRLAKSLPEFHDKSKLENDKLVINGMTYTTLDLHRLPPELAPYKTTQKSNATTIGFQGELSPWSNFHYSPFEIDGKQFTTAEHWIQSTKATFFQDKKIAEAIINCNTALEAKRWGYKVQGFDPKIWNEKGYDLCLPGIKAKYKQNPTLLNMLKTTAPQLLLESTNDKTWGIGVPLKETDALNKDKWHNTGWLSSMLMSIRDNPI